MRGFFARAILVAIVGAGGSRAATAQDIELTWDGSPNAPLTFEAPEGGAKVQLVNVKNKIPITSSCLLQVTASLGDQSLKIEGPDSSRFKVENLGLLLGNNGEGTFPIRYEALTVANGQSHEATLTIDLKCILIAANPGACGQGVVDCSASPSTVALKGTTIPAVHELYVRDWNGASGSDDGAEPSTEPAFWATSDVWNRWSADSGTCPDCQPVGEPARHGANWAYARIHRNEVPSQSAITATARFLFANFGAGNNFLPAGDGNDITSGEADPTVDFAPTEGVAPEFVSYKWELGGQQSPHLCLAVEINKVDDSQALDPLAAPSLEGWTPGPNSNQADHLVIDDNNKAQRNLAVVQANIAGANSNAVYFGLIHNAATVTRDITLHYEAQPETVKRLSAASIGIIGGPAKQLTSRGSIVLAAMQPAENRWVSLTFAPPKGVEGEILLVDFYELAGRRRVNGFSIGIQPSPMTQVAVSNLREHSSTFARLAEGFGVASAEPIARAAKQLLEQGVPSLDDYAEFLRKHSEAMGTAWRQVNPSVQDEFGVGAAANELKRWLESREIEAACVAHSSFLNRLDSFLTRVQLSRGCAADILQTVRWQAELFGALGCSGDVAAESVRFIEGFGKRTVSNKNYPDLIRRLMACFAQTADSVKSQVDLAPEIAVMEQSLRTPDLAAMQKAHRDYLLKLTDAMKIRERREPGS